jgi:hypothetical protein
MFDYYSTIEENGMITTDEDEADGKDGTEDELTPLKNMNAVSTTKNSYFTNNSQKKTFDGFKRFFY